MALLGKIRQRSFILIVIIALALFSFVLADVIQNGGFKQTSKNVGTINGNDISFEDFRVKVDALEKSGQEMTNIQAVNRVWDQEVNVALLNEELEKLGIRAGENHIVEVLKNNQNFGQNPMFQNEAGTFDINKFKEYFKSNPSLAGTLESTEKDAEINAKYQIYSTLIKAGYVTTQNDAKFKYELENNKVTFDFVSVPFSSIKDSDVTVSDQEIIDFMKKNEKKYKADETREIEYVVVEDMPSDNDKTEIKSKLQALMNSKVVYNKDTNANDTLAGFRNTTNVIEFVNSNSDFPYDSTYVAKTDLPAESAEQLFNLPTGEFFGPYNYGDYIAISKMMGRQAGAKAKASHILISYEGTQVPNKKEKRTKDEAKAKAESLFAEIQANPDSFLMSAYTSSDDSSSQQGGDLGFFGPNQMVKPFNDFVFNNSVGKIGLVETDFGFHIIKITDKQDAVRLATVARKIDASEKTTEAAYTKAVKLEMAANDKSFEDAVKDAKLTIATPVKAKALEENVGELGAQRPIVRWAYDSETKEGDIKRFEINKKGHVIAKLKKIYEEGLMSVSDARVTVEPILKNKKKAEKIMAKMKATTLDAIAKANNVTVAQAVDLSVENASLPNAGFEPKVVGTALSSAVNKVSAPIEGNSGVYVVSTKSVAKALPTKDYTTQLNGLKSQGANAPNRVFQILKDNAKIKDNRAMFNY